MMKRGATRRWTALTALFTLVWMQLAVAAYACPTLVPKPAEAVATHDCGNDANPAAMTDADNPNLCLQHQLQGDQHSDAGAPPASSPPPGLVIAVARWDRTPLVTTLITARERELLRATPPPKAVAHCCFRI